MAVDPWRLRLELLRLRGQMQRAELAQATAELRAAAERLRGLTQVLGRLGGVVSGAAGRPWAALQTLWADHPWLATAASALLARLLHRRRLRWAALGAAFAWWARRARRAPAADRNGR
ncbi:MAG: hypothetical protein RMK97_07520 [Sutterellaceae bacterium]|nr:hypothetical protein [Burkholderiaceae bacterium]MCX7902047.1 hypothetical protein [Burkholderiaceae bacterium]MDW8430334.1 hypothetical protein [Sutterellaceae bacterium]